MLRTVTIALIGLLVVSRTYAVDLVRIATSLQIPVKGVEIQQILTHDTSSYTQGLVFHDGYLYESTGLYGQSKIRQLDAKNGHVENGESLPAGFFGEGLAMWEHQLIQLTWQEHTAFIWDRATFELTNMWAYAEDGWGLCSDGTSLIMSDGTANIYYRSPYDFTIQRTVGVTFGRGRLNNLNELEYVNAKIFSNVLGADVILQIEPDTGEISAVVDCSDLRQEQGGNEQEQPLNGIAYDAGTNSFYLTGKHWSKIYRVKFTESSGG